MTAFTTPSLKSASASARAALARLLLGLCMCFCLGSLLAPGPSAAASTEITQLRVERADEGIFLTALVRFELSAAVQDALSKGIPLYFVVEADIYRDRWYWTDQPLENVVRTLRLAYQPLTRSWRVNIVSGLITSSSGVRATLNQNYDTLEEALSAIQRVARWKIADAADLNPGADYKISLNFKLDLSQLPRPFQIGVAGQRDWVIAAQLKERLRLQPSGPAPTPMQAPEPAGEGGKQ